MSGLATLGMLLICEGLQCIQCPFSVVILKRSSSRANDVRCLVSWLTVMKYRCSYAVFHCVKSAQIRSFFCSVFSCIRTEYGDLRSKYRPEKIPYLDTFRAVFLMQIIELDAYLNSETKNSHTHIHKFFKTKYPDK